MNTIQKSATAVIGIAMVTTLILPNRQTAQVIGAVRDLFRGTLATAMGTGKQV